MSIYKSSVNNPITTMMIFTGIIIFGLYSLTRLPIDFYPKMDLPMISVVTTYNGANASDIETNITKPLEDALNSIEGLKTLTSTSQDNLSVITMEFEWGTNLDESMNDVRTAIDGVYPNLPDGCQRPAVIKFSTSMMPILMYSVTAQESYPGLSKIINDKIINPLNRIDGVGSVTMNGAPQRTIYVDVDKNKLAAYHLSIEQVGNAIGVRNVNTPSGDVKMGTMDYQLRIEGQFKESDEIRNVVVANQDGTQILVKDLATVRDTLKDATMITKENGKNGIQLMVLKQSGANTVSVANDVKAMMQQIVKTLPSDVEVKEVFNSASFIQGSVTNLSDALLFALIFVAGVVFFFLGRWRATFIILLTIPVSLITALIYLSLTGNSLNIISLSSLSIAIGMVVDDAIVVLENITKHIERGTSPRDAAIYATNEVWLAVIVTTMVVVAVFLPLTFITGITGVMFNQLGWIVSITVVTSTLAAITITPMLSSRLLKLKEHSAESASRFSWDRSVGKWLTQLDHRYERTLHWALGHKKWVLGGAVVILGISIFLAQFIGTEFLPNSDQSRLQITAQLAPGTRVEITSQTARKIEKILAEKAPEVELVTTAVGANDQGGIAAIFNSSAGSNIINMTVRLKPIQDRKRSDVQIADAIRPYIAQLPEVINYHIATGGISFGTSSTFDIEIYGYDFNETNRLAKQIKNAVQGLEGVRDVQISRKDDQPELEISLDRQKLAMYGLTNVGVSTMIHDFVNGMTASKFHEEGDEYDIIVRLKGDARNSITALQEMLIPTPQGKNVALKELGTITEYWAPPNIDHKAKQRIVTVSITPVNVSLDKLATEVKGIISKMNVPSDVQIVLGGMYKDQQDSFRDLGLLLVLVILLVFIVMASQFESFSKPFAIMFSIPFAFTGVILALLITGTNLGMIAALGSVLLVGIVVKNGIVMVDFINLLRDRGLALNDAIEKGGRSRLRPVLMTASATFLGMVPMALSVGDGAETWTPMGITVIGGLIFSTLVTLIIVPVMYAILSKRGERDKESLVRKGFHFMDDLLPNKEEKE